MRTVVSFLMTSLLSASSLRLLARQRLALGAIEASLNVLLRKADPKDKRGSAASTVLALGACCAFGLSSSSGLCEEDAQTDGDEGTQWKSSAIARTFLQTGYGSFQLNMQVASYNMMCDSSVKQDTQEESSQANVSNLRDDVRNCRSDIVCLQEVSPEHYKDVLVPGFRKFGYNGTYKAHRIPNYGRLGMSIFWKADAFDLLSYRALNLTDVGGKLGPLETGHAIGGVFVMALRHRPSDMAFMVASAHVCGDITGQHMKTVQESLLFRALANFNLNEGIQAIPVIVCEDFNSLPWGSKAWEFDCESSTMTQLNRATGGGVRMQQGSLTVTIPMDEIDKAPAFLKTSDDTPIAAAFVECILFSPPSVKKELTM